MNPKKALRRFMIHVGSAPVGAHFETGIAYADRKGWRVYQRVADKALFMSPRDARRLAETFEKVAASPEWLGTEAAADIQPHFVLLRELADEADSKNASGARPDGMSTMSPFGGNA